MEHRDPQAIDDLRRGVLRGHGAHGDAAEALLEFNRSRIGEPPVAEPRFPLADELHLEAWSSYAEEAASKGAWEALSSRFAQLRFPIRAGVSQSEEYRAATLRGILPRPDSEAEPLLDRPGDLELLLHASIAGTVPLLVSGSREDFVRLVQAFTARGEPKPVPASMGACLVSGLNNWDRIHSHRREWAAADPEHRGDQQWREEFARLRTRKELYQDRFVILSRGRYSDASAASVGLDEKEWLERSFRLRRDHECTHYFTLRVFGKLQHNIVEELLADFVGILEAFGDYRADLALLFLGLEDFPVYRQGGRLENYRGEPPLGDDAFAALQSLSYAAVRNLERICADRPATLEGRESVARLVFTLAPLSLEELAADTLPARIGHL